MTGLLPWLVVFGVLFVVANSARLRYEERRELDERALPLAPVIELGPAQAAAERRRRGDASTVRRGGRS